MAFGLLSMLVYGVWRATTFVEGTVSWPINLTLFAGECVAILAQAALMFDAWKLWTFDPPRGTARPPVDVLIPVYNEPIEVLRPTLSGCVGQDYDGPTTVWLLDDGPRSELEQLAGDLGIRYLTRPDNAGAKAGNINHALGHLEGELVTILDCDMVPQPDYVSSLVPYFEDDQVALVQTPHGFYNTDSFQHQSTTRHDQSLFFDVLQWGKDRHNATYWCGTGGFLRTSALRQVGGVADETITEDFHTSIRLHAAGWRSRYHPIALTFGLGATNYATYRGQRDRWGSGNVGILHTADSPLTVRGLTLRQRLSYLATLVAVLAGLRRVLFVTGVALILGLAQVPFEADWRFLVSTLSLSVVGGMVAVLALARGRLALGDLSQGEILALPAQLSALRSLLLGRRRTMRFKVTAKDATADSWQAFVLNNVALLLLSGLLVLGMVVGLVRQATGHGLPPFAATLTFGLAIWEGTQIGLAWRFGLRYRQRRTSYRVKIENCGARLTVDGRTVTARLSDLSAAGAAIELFDEVDADMGDTVEFSIDGMLDPVRATVRRVQDWSLGLHFEHVPAQSGLIIDRMCYVDGVPDTPDRPAALPPAATSGAPGPASLAEALATAESEPLRSSVRGPADAMPDRA